MNNLAFSLPRHRILIQIQLLDRAIVSSKYCYRAKLSVPFVSCEVSFVLSKHHMLVDLKKAILAANTVEHSSAHALPPSPCDSDLVSWL